jgi:O-antigen/teichoic acid export membrane protein
MVNRAITFVLYALIARYLGTYEFGQMSLTLTLFYLLQSIAPTGLKTLLVRDVATHKEDTSRYLVNGLFVALVSSLAALLILLGFLEAMDYSIDTEVIILVVSASLIPYSLSAVCEAVFQAHEKIRYITFANVPVSLARGLLAFLLLELGFTLDWVGIIFIISYSATFILEWILLTRHIARPHYRVDLRFCWQIGRNSLAFLGLQSLVALSGSIVPVFLSKSAGEIEVGFLNAANQVTQPIMLLIQSTATSLFPRMSQHFDVSLQALKRVSERILEVLSIMTFPAVIGLFYYASPALLLLYQKTDFNAAVLVLQLSVWALIVKVITAILGRSLLAAHRERTVLTIMFIETIACLILAAWLVPSYGLIGAALAGLGITAVETILHLIPSWRMFGSINFLGAFWKAALATLVMTGWLVLVNLWQIPILAGILSSAAVYTAAWLIISLIQTGSWARLLKSFGGIR